jgi:hypothetical protein
MTDQGNIKIMSFVTIRDPDSDTTFVVQNDSFIGGVSPLSAEEIAENEAARARFTAAFDAMGWEV